MLKFLRVPFAASGDRAEIPADLDPNGNVSYEQGYGYDYQRQKTDPAAKNIERDKMNGLFFDLTTAIRELQAQGVPDFITPELNGGDPFEYAEFALVRYSDGKLYVSLVDANTTSPTNTENWAEFDAALALHLSASSGAGLIGYLRYGAGAVPKTLEKWMNYRRVSVFEFMTETQIAAVQAGTFAVDVTAPIAAALAAHKRLDFPDGGYKVTDEFLLDNGHSVRLCPGTTIRQYTQGKTVFKAIQKLNAWVDLNGGSLRGPGGWSASWTGNQGQEGYRAVRFLGCVESGIMGPGRIYNWGNAGVDITGGQRIRIFPVSIEGTHEYGTPLPPLANFQNGVYIVDDATYGAADDVIVFSPDISGTAQGVLRENIGSAPLAEKTTQIVTPNIHDIPGQHAFYIQTGKMAITSPTLTNIHLSGVKIQSGDAGEDIDGFTCTGVAAQGLGGALFEIATVGGGSLSDLILSGTADGCGYGLAVNAKVKDLEATVNVKNVTGNALYVQGNNCQDLDIDLYANGVAQDGVLITATNSSGIRVRPVIRNPNTASAPSGCGIRVSSASANVELFDPDVTDANGKMLYGLFNDTAGSDVKVRGSARFTGAADVAIRAMGDISEFPTEATLQGTNGPWYLGNIRSSQSMLFPARSTSASNVVLWVQNLADESAYLVKFDLVGKSLNSSERRVVSGVACFYRDGGGVATLQGAPTINADIASAGFAGGYLVTGNGAEGAAILVNSGGAATYDWKARITVTPLY